MNCFFCQTELKPTVAFNFFASSLAAQPGFECPHCWALFDSNGDAIQGPLADEYPEPKIEHDERGDFIWSYGHFGSGDPRDFDPDMELCSPEEIERWKADKARAEAGEDVTAPPAGTWISDDKGEPIMHILAPKYGIGSYKYRLDDIDAPNGGPRD